MKFALLAILLVSLTGCSINWHKFEGWQTTREEEASRWWEARCVPKAHGFHKFLHGLHEYWENFNPSAPRLYTEKHLVRAAVAAPKLYSVDYPPVLPDPILSPGCVLENRSIEVILAHGYTASAIGGVKVRAVPLSVHRQVFVRYFGKVPDKPGLFEVDHVVSLELGGDNSVSNLFPQPYFTQWNARTKDRLENKLASLCRAELLARGHEAAVAVLALFQKEIASNWTNAYKKYVGPSP